MKKMMIFISVMLLLTGCGHAKVESGNSKESMEQKETKVLKDTSVSQIDFPDTYQTKDGNVSINCQITTNDSNLKNGLYTAKASLIPIDNAKAFDLLYPQKEGYTTYSNKGKNEFNQDAEMKTVDYNHEITFSYGPESSALDYAYGPRFSYITSAFDLDTSTDEYNADKYSLDKDLTFMKRVDAYHQVNDILEQIGAKAEYQYKGYALDYQTMKAEESHEDIDGNQDQSSYKKEWTEADDCYYFVLRQYYQDLPAFHMYADTFPEESDENTPIQVIYSKDGVLSMDIEKIFNFSNKKSVASVMQFKDIAKIVMDKYNQILGNATYTFDSAELVYYVDVLKGNGEYSVRPCWIIKGRQNAQNSKSNIQLIIDAQTGEEIVK